MSVITITDGAAEHITQLIAASDKPVAGLRLGTSTQGCSGLGYKVDYVEEASPDDEVVNHNGVSVFVDRKSLLFLLGTVMDYEEGLFSTGFTFTNPNEKGRCGCGESFTV